MRKSAMVNNKNLIQGKNKFMYYVLAHSENVICHLYIFKLSMTQSHLQLKSKFSSNRSKRKRGKVCRRWRRHIKIFGNIMINFMENKNSANYVDLVTELVHNWETYFKIFLQKTFNCRRPMQHTCWIFSWINVGITRKRDY